MDYQGNTRKEREKEQQKENIDRVMDKKIEKVITGEAIIRQKGIGRKFKNIFFGGDAKQAIKFVATDVLFPEMRNIIFDVIKGYAERVIFPDTAYRRRRPTGVNYNARYQYQSSRSPLDPRDRYPSMPVSSRVRSNRYDVEDIVVGTREEADLVIERLMDVLDKYDVVSLSDLKELIGWETSHIDNKWGWTYLNNVQVRQVREGYLLELPMAEEI